MTLLQVEAEVMEHEFDAVLAARFARRSPTFIRTNDALHLAAAKAAGETQFITADTRQAEVARLLGFSVLL